MEFFEDFDDAFMSITDGTPADKLVLYLGIPDTIHSLNSAINELVNRTTDMKILEACVAARTLITEFVRNGGYYNE